MEFILFILLVWFVYALYSKDEINDAFKDISNSSFFQEPETHIDSNTDQDEKLHKDFDYKFKYNEHLKFKPDKTSENHSYTSKQTNNDQTYKEPETKAYIQSLDHCVPGSHEWLLLKKKYMKSKEWKIKRKQRLEFDKYQCVKCKQLNLPSTQKLEIHHITYENIGNEKLNDIVSLCRDHHQEIHDHYGYDHSNIFPINPIYNKEQYMLHYNNNDLKVYPRWISILTHYNLKEITDEEIWEIARNSKEIPQFENILLDETAKLITDHLKKIYPDHTFDAYINSIDSHLYCDNDEFKDIDELHEILYGE